MGRERDTALHMGALGLRQSRQTVPEPAGLGQAAQGHEGCRRDRRRLISGRVTISLWPGGMHSRLHTGNTEFGLHQPQVASRIGATGQVGDGDGKGVDPAPRTAQAPGQTSIVDIGVVTHIVSRDLDQSVPCTQPIHFRAHSLALRVAMRNGYADLAVQTPLTASTLIIASSGSLFSWGSIPLAQCDTRTTRS